MQISQVVSRYKRMFITIERPYNFLKKQSATREEHDVAVSVLSENNVTQHHQSLPSMDNSKPSSQ